MRKVVISFLTLITLLTIIASANAQSFAPRPVCEFFDRQGNEKVGWPMPGSIGAGRALRSINSFQLIQCNDPFPARVYWNGNLCIERTTGRPGEPWRVVRGGCTNLYGQRSDRVMTAVYTCDTPARSWIYRTRLRLTIFNTHGLGNTKVWKSDKVIRRCA